MANFFARFEGCKASARVNGGWAFGDFTIGECDGIETEVVGFNVFEGPRFFIDNGILYIGHRTTSPHFDGEGFFGAIDDKDEKL